MAKVYKGGEFLVSESVCGDIFSPEDFSDEQRQIAATTEQFITNEVLPKIEEIDQQNFALVVETLKKAGELGLLMIDAPEEFGGLDLDKATSMLVTEKIAPGGSFAVAYLAHNGIGTLPLVYYGTDAQKRQYLEKIISGEWMAAYCLTEPGSGSDALSATTNAVLSEDEQHYILNGTKQFITNAGFADLFTVFAKVDKEHFTGFLVERTVEGVSIGPEEKKMGIKGSSTTQVIFDNVKVPVENLLGEIGKGHKIAFNVLNVGRFKLGALVTGMAKHAIGEAIKYANERKQFNRPISSFGAIQQKLADMTAATYASESLVYRLAGQIDDRLATLDKGSDNYYAEYQKGIEEYAAECAIAKVYCSEVLAEVVDEVLQVFGGYGFVSEYPAERFYRDERIQRIYEGTNEINRILIPGVFLRKEMKGELPLQEAAVAAFNDLAAGPNTSTGDGVFAEENALLVDLKRLFLVVIGTAVQTYQNELQNEQEVLMAVADVAIQIYALESVVLRAEKTYAQVSAAKQGNLVSIVKICAFDASEKLITAAKKATYFMAEAVSVSAVIEGIHKLGSYDATGLLRAKRSLAKAAIDSEKYIF